MTAFAYTAYTAASVAFPVVPDAEAVVFALEGHRRPAPQSSLGAA